jgi:WD40 repeat protein
MPMRRASLLVSTLVASLAPLLALADDPPKADPPKAPANPECKGFLQSEQKKIRLVGLLGDYLWKGADEVTNLGFTDDGRSVVAATSRELTVYDRGTGRDTLSYKLEAPCVLSADGKRMLVLADPLGCVEIAEKKLLWKAEGRARTACFSWDGKRVLAVSGTELTLHDAEKGRVLKTFHLDAGPDLVLLSPDGTHVLAGDARKLQAYEIEHVKKQKAIESPSRITALGWSDGLLVTASEDAKLRAWDLDHAKVAWERASKKPILALAVGSKEVATLGDDGVTVRDASGNELRTFETTGRAVAIAPDGLAAASARTAVRLHTLATGQTLEVPEDGHMGSVMALALSFDQLHVLSAGADGTARLWNAQTNKIFRVLQGTGAPVTGVAFAPDAKQALTGSDDGTLKLWDMKTGAVSKTLSGAGPVGAVSFLDKLAVAADTDGTLHPFELGTAKKLPELGTSAARAPVALGAKLALLATEKGTVKVWDLDLGRESCTLEGRVPVRALALSEDEKRALVGGQAANGQGMLKLFDAQSATELRSFEVGNVAVTAVAFSPDGKFGLSALEDGRVGLWELASGQLVDRIDLGTSRDRALAACFTKEGFLLGTARGVLLRFEWIGA